jgi:hypothetical protein
VQVPGGGPEALADAGASVPEVFAASADVLVLGRLRCAWSLPAGWPERRPVLPLPLLPAHVKMFGSGCAGAVVQRLDELEW